MYVRLTALLYLFLHKIYVHRNVKINNTFFVFMEGIYFPQVPILSRNEKTFPQTLCNNELSFLAKFNFVLSNSKKFKVESNLGEGCSRHCLVYS